MGKALVLLPQRSDLLPGAFLIWEGELVSPRLDLASHFLLPATRTRQLFPHFGCGLLQPSQRLLRHRDLLAQLLLSPQLVRKRLFPLRKQSSFPHYLRQCLGNRCGGILQRAVLQMG